MSSVRLARFTCQAFGFSGSHVKRLVLRHVKRLGFQVHMSSVWVLRFTCQAFGFVGSHVKRSAC